MPVISCDAALSAITGMMPAIRHRQRNKAISFFIGSILSFFRRCQFDSKQRNYYLFFNGSYYISGRNIIMILPKTLPK